MINLINLLLSFLITITLHEFSHYILAKIFNRNPSLRFEKIIFPYIECNNSNKYFENCIINIAPVLTHLILFFISKDFLRLFNLCFILVFPISSDGFLFYINLIKYISNKKHK